MAAHDPLLDRRRRRLWEVEYRWHDPEGSGHGPGELLAVRRFVGQGIATRKATTWVDHGILDGVQTGLGLPGRTADIYCRERIDTIEGS